MANVADATMTTPAESAESAVDATTESQTESQTASQSEQAAEAETSASQTIRFAGTQRNMVSGIAMLFASIMAFTMGMTDVYFAEATAWTFAIWGGLLIYAGVLDLFRVYEVTEEALVIKDDWRPWNRLKVWDWERLNRVDILVKKNNAQPKDLELQVYYNPEGELAMEREDRIYDAELARLIIERAGLSPSDRNNPSDLTQIPLAEKNTYTWS